MSDSRTRTLAAGHCLPHEYLLASLHITLLLTFNIWPPHFIEFVFILYLLQSFRFFFFVSLFILNQFDICKIDKSMGGHISFLDMNLSAKRVGECGYLVWLRRIFYREHLVNYACCVGGRQE